MVKKKAKVYREEAKERHTSHWDLDYLSREELERVMKQKGYKSGDGKKPDSDAEDESRGH